VGSHKPYQANFRRSTLRQRRSTVFMLPDDINQMQKIILKKHLATPTVEYNGKLLTFFHGLTKIPKYR
jgi:hypothetical protein